MNYYRGITDPVFSSAGPLREFPSQAMARGASFSVRTRRLGDTDRRSQLRRGSLYQALLLVPTRGHFAQA